MQHRKLFLSINGKQTPAVAPVIISASRATDLPAFHADWFAQRLKQGYCIRQNPFNGIRQHVSFQDARVFVFWSKNPEPLLKHLHLLDNRGLGYYFQFTLNDYETERFEPAIPPLEKRIALFQKLSVMLGRSRVVWRFDPLLITRSTPPERLLEKILSVGRELHKYTERLVISFADIAIYPRIERALKKTGWQAREFSEAETRAFAAELTAKTRQWGLDVRACAEKIDLSAQHILANKCIDDELLAKLFPHDADLMRFLGRENPCDPAAGNSDSKLKDKGQRKPCRCILSKDIGHYNTCGHLCVYCYANSTTKSP